MRQGPVRRGAAWQGEDFFCAILARWRCRAGWGKAWLGVARPGPAGQGDGRELIISPAYRHKLGQNNLPGLGNAGGADDDIRR